jgi:hypothetical protein
MARARNIKPGLFKNELLGVADPFLMILFESLWCIADREGRLEDRPLRIKAETFPYRDGMDVNGYLTELQRLGFICRYMVGGDAFIQVLNFHKHQNLHKTERASEIPEMPIKSEGCALTEDAPLKNGSRPADSLIPDSLIPDSLIPDSLIPDSGFPQTDSGTLKTTTVDRRSAPTDREPDPVPEIFAYWQKVMQSPASKLDAKRMARIRAALKLGYTPRQLCEAFRGCSLTPHNMGQNDRNTKFNSIELILRSADHIDRFIACALSPPKAGGPETIEQQNARIMDELFSEDEGETLEMAGES